MRRGVVFAVLTAPAVAWAVTMMWAQSKAAEWTPAAGELDLPIRVVLASGAWVTRFLPFAALPVMLAWPLIVWGMASVTGSRSSQKGTTWRDIVLWWSVSTVAFAAMLVPGGIYYFSRPASELPMATLACLAWMGVVAFWLSLAAAYGVQQQRYLARTSEWHPGKMLAALAVLNCAGLLALPVLVAITFRKNEVVR